MKLKETFAVISVVVILVGVPAFVVWYQHSQVLGQYPPEARVLTLTGVGKDGVWTLETVNSSNYWWKTFSPETLHFEEGEQVVLRLQSADVTHRFYAPGLGVGPVEVDPGLTVAVQIHASPAGTYEYYCTAICGDCHFYMHGWIVVTPKGETPKTPPPAACSHDFEEPPQEDMIRWGRYLHQKMGCITCHGVEGRGGIVNVNYIKETVPPHNTLAEKFFLEEEEDARVFIDLLVKGVDFDQLEEQPDIPRFILVLTQYRAAKELIRKGKHCAKLDATGPDPPRQMPAWEERLSERDIDAIISYLLTLYPWEEDEE